jgi:hypothetical protein
MMKLGLQHLTYALKNTTNLGKFTYVQLERLRSHGLSNSKSNMPIVDQITHSSTLGLHWKYNFQHNCKPCDFL